MAFDRIPIIAGPPHDPTSLLLNGRVGWRTSSASDVEVGADGVVQLSPLASSLPALANSAGTFGNWVLPSNAALTPDGTLLLLDRDSAELKRFDRCKCAFVRVPGLGKHGHSPRHWRAPQGIGVCRGALYVCDPLLEGVLVFLLAGFAFRGVLRPPRAQFPNWQPMGIAFDSSGRAFVSDRLAGLVHRFDRHGVWQRVLAGFAEPTWLAFDCSDRLFVTTSGAGTLEVQIVDAEGTRLDLPTRSDRFAHGFPTLPIEVDSSGRLHLGPWCAELPSDECEASAAAGSGWFGADGLPLVAAPPASTPQYVDSGELVIGPLDSRIAACTWHRLLLDAVVPEDSLLSVSTFSAEQPIANGQLATLADWSPRLEVAGEAWDGLVRSPPGRYLWLKLTLGSSGPHSAALNEITVEFPRLSSLRYLPAVFNAEAVSADFTDRLASLFDTTMRGIEHQVDTQARWFDPLSAPATRVDGSRTDFLSWLGSWIGVSLDRRWDEARRRRFLKAAGGLFDCRGTLAGLKRTLELVLGFDTFDRICPQAPEQRRCACAKPNCAACVAGIPWRRPPLVLEHFRLRRWLQVGAGRLGAESVLWGNQVVNRTSLDVNARADGSRLLTSQDPVRDPYQVFAHRFSVFVPARYQRSEKERRALEALLKSESPAHTRHQLVFVEPRFRIGVQSMIGFDSVVGGVPRGARLGAATLTGSTTISGRREGDAARFAVGRMARVGATTRVG